MDIARVAVVEFLARDSICRAYAEEGQRCLTHNIAVYNHAWDIRDVIFFFTYLVVSST